MMTTYPDLQAIAATMGVTITEHTGGNPGWYHHPTRTISMRAGQSTAQYRSVLAHELGHALHHDTHCVPCYATREEHRADIYAANLLISQQEYMAAETLHDGHLGAIAEELDVTVHLIEVWRKHNEHLKWQALTA